MKQALLITAYKNIAHLQNIIAHFDENYSFYIHIDKKSNLPEHEIAALKKQKRVFISRAFKTNWGGTSHLKCILLLMKMALKDHENKYLHLISGHDFPIKTSASFSAFLKKNEGKQFMEYFELPSQNWEHGGMDRLAYYNFYDLINAKGKYGYILHKLVNLQKKLNMKRKTELGNMQLYGGSTWWTLSYDCCCYMMQYLLKNPGFSKQFNLTFCAEEIFFQTLILNSPFKESVVNNNLRHIVWELRNGNMPAVLDKSDYELLKQSKHLFARRFEYPESEKLVTLLKSMD